MVAVRPSGAGDRGGFAGGENAGGDSAGVGDHAVGSSASVAEDSGKSAGDFGGNGGKLGVIAHNLRGWMAY